MVVAVDSSSNCIGKWGLIKGRETTLIILHHVPPDGSTMVAIASAIDQIFDVYDGDDAPRLRRQLRAGEQINVDGIDAPDKRDSMDGHSQDMHVS